MIYKGLVSYGLYQSMMIKNDLQEFQKKDYNIALSEQVMRGVPSQCGKVGSQQFL